MGFKRFTFWGTLILIYVSTSFTNGQNLTNNSRISLITCDAGNEIYAHFGHSAIWVYDDSLGIDKVYNYGTFDFDDPDFMIKFASGKLLYKLSISDMDHFIYEYVHSNRTVRELLLNLSLNQKKKIYQFLENNYLPENRYYLYDFYFDNCATRIRDVFENALGDSLQLDYSLFENKETTFRQLIKPDLIEEKWLTLGIDLILGAGVDNITMPKEFTFLPINMEKSFENGDIVDNTLNKPFVLAKRTLFEAKPQPQKKNSRMQNPTFIMWMLFVLLLLIFIWAFRKQIKIGVIDFFLWLIPALLGFVLVLLMLFSDHHVVKDNWNVLWANPVHIVFVWGLLRKNSPRWVKKYFRAYGFFLILFLLFMGLLPQDIPSAVIPYVLILFISSQRIQRVFVKK